MHRADVFIGLSVPGILSVRDVKRMARDPIVFAMANPVPEIQPEEAERHVRVMATGRSDYPNQINNVLCFPGFFRGLLDSRARTVNDDMKLAAARALAACVEPQRAERGVHHPERVQQERGARRGHRRGPRRLGHRLRPPPPPLRRERHPVTPATNEPSTASTARSSNAGPDIAGLRHRRFQTAG